MIPIFVGLLIFAAFVTWSIISNDWIDKNIK